MRCVKRPTISNCRRSYIPHCCLCCFPSGILTSLASQGREPVQTVWWLSGRVQLVGLKQGCCLLQQLQPLPNSSMKISSVDMGVLMLWSLIRALKPRMSLSSCGRSIMQSLSRFHCITTKPTDLVKSVIS